MKNTIGILLVIFTCASASDSDLATALAESGAVQAAKGNIQQAKDLYYKALVYDKDCAVALFELAKIEEKSGNKAIASTLYVRALPGLKGGRRDIADAKIKFSDPVAAKMTAALNEYVRGLERIVQSRPDQATSDAIQKRITDLHLADSITPPKFPALHAFLQGDRDAVGIYRYKGPWWESEFKINSDKTFMRIPIMIGGTWKMDGKTIRLTHSDGTLDILVLNKTGYSNARVTLTMQISHK